MRLRSFHGAMILIGVILGVLLSLQFRLTMDIQQNESARRTKDLSIQVVQMKKEQEALKAQVVRMRSELDRLSAGPLVPNMKEEMERYEVLAGVTGLTGSGVEVTLTDSSSPLKTGENPNLYIVHDEDILNVVNELKAAGAEAISINGQRLVATTEISCNGPTIRVNNKPLAPAFVIHAIGDPETLERSLKIKGGMVETLQFYGIQVFIKKLTQVTVPAYTGSLKYEYVKAEI